MARGAAAGLTSLDAVVEGKVVTLTGEAESIEAGGKAMAEFNKMVETENTLNEIRLATPPPTAAPAAGPAPVAVPTPAGRIHVVEKGDTLGAIAKKYYGKAGLYPKIFEANRDVLDDPDLIRPGQKLRIPD